MPDDVDWICRKARAVSEGDKAVIMSILDEFFTRKAGKVFSPKLAEIWLKGSVSYHRRVLAGSKGGAAKAAKTNEKVSSNATAMLQQLRTRIREERTQPNGCGSEAASQADSDDFSKQVFDRAVAYLGRHGTPERKARSFVGKLRKDGHSDAAIFEAFMTASREGVVDPIPWIIATLVPPKYEVKFDLSKFEDHNEPH